jgi:hypothetical protein
MSETLEIIQRAVENIVGGPVSHFETVSVAESFRGKLIWKGMVEVFKVKNPPPDKAYGWVFPAQGYNDYVAFLGVPPINTPSDAVRVWILGDQAFEKGEK